MDYGPELVEGLYTRAHLAYAAGVTVGSLAVMVANEQLPPLPNPVHRLYRTNLYSQNQVDAYRDAVARHRGQSDERNALRQVDRERRRQAAMEEQERYIAQQQRLREAYEGISTADARANAEAEQHHQSQMDLATKLFKG